MSGGLERARRDLDAGRPRLARQRLKSLLVILPDDRDVRRLLAAAYRRDGQPTEAGRWGFLHADAASPRERRAFLDHVRYRRDRRIRPERLRRLLKTDDPTRIADGVGAELVREATRRRPRVLVAVLRLLRDCTVAGRDRRTSAVARDGVGPAQPLITARLQLDPLRVQHAQEMAPLLDDAALYAFTGGEPDTLEGLRARYARQVPGRSPDGSERWLNWVVRRRDGGQAVGTVQATLSEGDGCLTADIAWVVGAAHQRQGFAREAAQALVGWLRTHGVEVVVAHIHPEHTASMAVARAVGLVPTNHAKDGETRWQG